MRASIETGSCSDCRPTWVQPIKGRWRRTGWLSTGLVLVTLLTATTGSSDPFKIAVFSADVTVPLNHGMMGGKWRSTSVADPLEAKGLVILGGDRPIVFVSLDWCEIRNGSFDAWRAALAETAETTADRVLVVAIHQHDAPVADTDAEAILRERKLDASVCDLDFHRVAIERVQRSMRRALTAAVPCTHLGLGMAEVKGIASNRRYVARDGTIRFDRTSASTSEEAMLAPEGTIDPVLRSVSFWREDQPIAVVSVYAVHPMSFYGKGEVSADFPGLARRRREKDVPGVEQIFANGCAGNITAGKFNRGGPGDRLLLADRLHGGMQQAWESTRRVPWDRVSFRKSKVRFQPRDTAGFTVADLEKGLEANADPWKQCLCAMGLAWRRRLDAGHEVDIPCVDFGVAQWIVLPGETYVEYQLAAQRLRPDSFVVAMGYGEAGTGYVPTENHVKEGDTNLSDWWWIAPGAEPRLLQAIQEVLAVQP